MEKLTFSLEQARTLDAVARAGSFAKAAKYLNKVHSAVVYSLQGLEDSAGVPLFDRSGYRTTLTPVGERVLELCRKLLQTEEELGSLCRSAKLGYEPFLKVVFEAMLPAEPIMRAVRAVGAKSPSTRVSLYSEFLQGVDERYERERADLMVSILPPAEPFRTFVRLPPLTSWLVAHKDHPLAARRTKLELQDLEGETFLTVRGSDRRLGMSTSALEMAAVFQLSDFHAKKSALKLGMGFGWMPEYLIEKELAKKELLVLRWGEEGGKHRFEPVLYCRETSAAGRACRVFREAITAF